MTTSRLNEVKAPQHLKTPRSDGREVLVLPLLLEAGPLDVGEALLLPIGGPSRLHDELGVRRGICGGGDAAPGRNWVERADGSRDDLGATGSADMQPGDAFVILTPGGGAFGPHCPDQE